MPALWLVFSAYVLLHQSHGAPTGMSSSGLGPCHRTDSKAATCEDIPDLQCHNGTSIQVCNWATMEVLEVKCIYNHFAKRCQPSRKWDIYVSRTPCEVHMNQTTCEHAISPESLYYASQRTCKWTLSSSKPDAKGLCQSPLPAFFYLLTTEGLIFRVDPYQKQLQYVREDGSVTAIASDANTMTGMYMMTRTNVGQTLSYLKNIESDATQPEDLGVPVPHSNSKAGLGENLDGSILTADGQSVYVYNAGRRRKNKKNSPTFDIRQHGCNYHVSGDLVGHPSATHANFTVREQHLYMVSRGQLLQWPRCKTYATVSDKLTALAFTCNGELYAGTQNTIYRIYINDQHQPETAEVIITLNARTHIIQDFASQPGCTLYNPKRRR